MAGAQFVVSSLAGQDRTRAPLTRSIVGIPIFLLAVAVVVVTPPRVPERRFDLQTMIDYLQRIDDQRIVSAPNAVPHQFEKACVDYLARLEVRLLARLAIVDMNPARGKRWIVKRLSLRRRTNPHVVVFDLRKQHALLRRGPLIEVRFNPVRI